MGGWKEGETGGGATSDRRGTAQSSSEREGTETRNERQKADCKDERPGQRAALLFWVKDLHSDFL